MKIAFVGTFPSHENAPMSGPRRICVNVARALAPILGSQMDVFAYGALGTGVLQKVFGRRVTGQRFGLRIISVGYLVLPLYARHYDVIYFAGGPFHALLPVLWSRFFRFPKIVYCAAGVIRMERKLHAAEETRAPYWKECIEGVVIKSCQSVVCLSPLCADTVVQEWGIPYSKTVVIPQGVGEAFFSSERRPEPSVPPLKVVTVSQVHQYKGLEFLLEALSKLVDFEIQLFIISTGGSSVYRRHLESIISSTDGRLQGKVTFVGPCDVKQLKDFFASACLYVQASKHETFCLAVLEAMSSGLPVVVTKTTGMSYLLKDGVNGYVVSFGDTDALAHRIEILLKDAALRDRIGKTNIARARQINWNASAEALVDHFRALLQTHAPNSQIHREGIVSSQKMA